MKASSKLRRVSKVYFLVYLICQFQFIFFFQGGVAPIRQAAPEAPGDSLVILSESVVPSTGVLMSLVFLFGRYVQSDPDFALARVPNFFSRGIYTTQPKQ